MTGSLDRARVRGLHEVVPETLQPLDPGADLRPAGVVLEPVDADYQPTPPGQFSHTVLLTNLANQVQPLLRYNLGDSVQLRPDPCPCGNPLPAIQVQGRAGDTLSFPTERGEAITLAPLAFSTLFDRTPGVELFQIEQTTPTTLRVRMLLAADAEPNRVWQTVLAELERLLTTSSTPSPSNEAKNHPDRSPAAANTGRSSRIADTPVCRRAWSPIPDQANCRSNGHVRR